MKYFFDSHMHCMNLSHPDFSSIITNLQTGFSDLLTSGFLSSSYLFKGKLATTNEINNRLANLLQAFEKPIGETFLMIEDDLKGKFKPSKNNYNNYPEKPYIRNNKFYFRENEFDKFVLCPLVMDFSNDNKDFNNIYYPQSKEKKILRYADDTLEGIKYYEEKNKDGLFEFFPFIGINPPAHSLEFIKDLLTTYIINDKRSFDTINSKNKFYGVKFYPPLGTNPWPEDREEKEKMLYIYDFCVNHNLPIITHCDDQGFRTLSTKKAWQYTDPNSWIPVLKEFPLLKIDFAHCGKQYSSISTFPITAQLAQNSLKLKEHRNPSSPWFYNIISLMDKYPNIYMDVSFSGTSHSFYLELDNFLASERSNNKSNNYIDKILFGSDFSVNLFKMESYTQYLHIFETSKFSNLDIFKICSTNPISFLNSNNKICKTFKQT